MGEGLDKIYEDLVPRVGERARTLLDAELGRIASVGGGTLGPDSRKELKESYPGIDLPSGANKMWGNALAPRQWLHGGKGADVSCIGKWNELGKARGLAVGDAKTQQYEGYLYDMTDGKESTLHWFPWDLNGTPDHAQARFCALTSNTKPQGGRVLPLWSAGWSAMDWKAFDQTCKIEEFEQDIESRRKAMLKYLPALAADINLASDIALQSRQKITYRGPATQKEGGGVEYELMEVFEGKDGQETGRRATMASNTAVERGRLAVYDKEAQSLYPAVRKPKVQMGRSDDVTRFYHTLNHGLLTMLTMFRGGQEAKAKAQQNCHRNTVYFRLCYGGGKVLGSAARAVKSVISQSPSSGLQGKFRVGRVHEHVASCSTAVRRGCSADWVYRVHMDVRAWELQSAQVYTGLGPSRVVKVATGLSAYQVFGGHGVPDPGHWQMDLSTKYGITGTGRFAERLAENAYAAAEPDCEMPGVDDLGELVKRLHLEKETDFTEQMGRGFKRGWRRMVSPGSKIDKLTLLPALIGNARSMLRKTGLTGITRAPAGVWIHPQVTRDLHVMTQILSSDCDVDQLREIIANRFPDVPGVNAVRSYLHGLGNEYLREFGEQATISLLERRHGGAQKLDSYLLEMGVAPTFSRKRWILLSAAETPTPVGTVLSPMFVSFFYKVYRRAFLLDGGSADFNLQYKEVDVGLKAGLEGQLLVDPLSRECRAGRKAIERMIALSEFLLCEFVERFADYMLE